MDSTIGNLLLKVNTLKEDMKIWEKWHCKIKGCDSHMCRIRETKMLNIKLRLELLNETCDKMLELRRSGIK